MRQLQLLIAVLVLAVCSATKNAPQFSTALNGNWLPVKQALGGNTLPPAFYEKQRLLIADSTYTLYAESIDKGILQYQNGRMDIYGRQGVNSGKHFTCIYSLEDSLLTICYNLKGDGYPASFDSGADPAYFLSVYKKQ